MKYADGPAFNRISGTYRGWGRSGRTVTVTEDGQAATVYADEDLTTALSPVVTGADGSFQFFVLQGTYTVAVAGGNSETWAAPLAPVDEASLAGGASALTDLEGVDMTGAAEGDVLTVDADGIVVPSPNATSAAIQIESGGAYAEAEGRIFSGADDPTLLPGYVAQEGDLWLPTSILRGQGQKFTAGFYYGPARTVTGYNGMTLNRIYYTRWYLEVPFTYSGYALNVTSAGVGAVIRFAAYLDNGSIHPGAKVTGSDVDGVSGASTGARTGALAANLTLPAGHIWIATSFTVATLTCDAISDYDPLIPITTVAATSRHAYLDNTFSHASNPFPTTADQTRNPINRGIATYLLAA